MAAALRQTQQWDENTNFPNIKDNRRLFKTRRGTSTASEARTQADSHRYCGEVKRNQCGTLDNQVLVVNTNLLKRAARKKGENEMLSPSRTHVTRASTSHRIAGMPAHSPTAWGCFWISVLTSPRICSFCLSRRILILSLSMLRPDFRFWHELGSYTGLPVLVREAIHFLHESDKVVSGSLFLLAPE